MIKPHIVIESHTERKFLKVADEVGSDVYNLYHQMINAKDGSTIIVNGITITKSKSDENHEYLMENQKGEVIVRITCKF